MTSFLVFVAAHWLLSFLHLLLDQPAAAFRLLWLLLGGSTLVFCDWLDFVHVCNGCLKVWVRAKFFLRHAKQFTHIYGLTSITIDDFKQALSGDAIVFRWVVLLALVARHFATDIIELRLTCRLAFSIRVFAFAEAEKLLHYSL